MILRHATSALAIVLPLATYAQALFPEPDADGCFAIAEDFSFCGAPLGWVGSASSHPDITAIFDSETQGEWLFFEIFDPETGTLGAMNTMPSEGTDTLIDMKRQAIIQETDIAPEGGEILDKVSSTIADYDVQTTVFGFSEQSGSAGIRVMSVFTGEPWFLALSTSSKGNKDKAWQRHVEALGALNIEK